jgi:sulfotransferase
MIKTFHFLSGLPRTGSTVLCSILNQNPKVYVTPTSPLLGLLLHNQEAFHKLEEVIANPIPEQLTNISRAMINSAWEHRSEEIIIDKHRGWGKNMNASTIVFGKEIKIVATVRDLPSIMASWLTLIRNYPYEFDKKLASKGLPATDENRMGEMWFNMTKDCMESVVAGRQTASNRLLLVDYDDFVVDPLKEIRRIESFLDLPSHDYDINNIKQEASDDLGAWGFPDLHKIRSSVNKTSKTAREVLGEDLYNRFVDIEKQYQYR